MKYNIIYADCPWAYNDRCHAGKRGAEYKYPTMTDAEIKALPIKEIVADDAVLFMWATFPRLEAAFEVMRSWGFEYKTVGFVWVKRNKLSPTWFMGMGNWTRSNSELCLLGTRGKPKRINASVHSVVDTPIEMHSKKPEVVRERIVQLMGALPRLEMFARQATPGWDVFGNQVEGSITLPKRSLLTLDEVEDLKQSVAQRQEDMLDVRYPGVFE